VYYAKAKVSERAPLIQPLAAFPRQVGSFRFQQEGVVEREVRDVLKADELLSRVYAADSATGVNLFMAYFKSQRTGVRPHSPMNCLPGSGWAPLSKSMLAVEIPSRKKSIAVNRYLVTKGEATHLVLYWYHSHNRAVASEYASLLYTILDSIRYNRSDASIVRVVIPVSDHEDKAAEETGIRFVQSFYPYLEEYFPA
jgi:EpsI family protein